MRPTLVTSDPIPLEDASPIRALHSLTAAQAEALEAVVRRLPGRWSAERHEGYDGHLSVLIAPEGGDEAGPSLVAHRDAGGLRLDTTRWDGWEAVGRFDTLPSLLEALLTAVRDARPVAA